MPDQVRNIPVQLVDPSPYQPRRHFDDEAIRELAASIRQHGIIQPVIVREIGERFELIAGERRLRAARSLGLEAIPALVRRYTDEQALEAALVENLQREDISVVEAALAYQRLAEEFHYSQAEIAQRTGKSRAAVSNTLRLLHLPEPLLHMLERDDLTEGHARALLALPYPSLQVEVGEWVVRNALTVRETERKVKALLTQTNGTRRQETGSASPTDVHLAAVEEHLRRRFSTKVGLRYRKGKGLVTLEFYDDEDLNRLLELLGVQDPSGPGDVEDI
jgi:ParB family transcriptional regulator, chromosome partitioning protein